MTKNAQLDETSQQCLETTHSLNAAYAHNHTKLFFFYNSVTINHHDVKEIIARDHS